MENIQINTNSEIDLSLIILNLLCAFVISLLIKFHYKKYSTTLTNRDDFSNLFPFITLTIVLVIYIVKSSLALSLGLVGALSIVRFRTPIKEPEELAYLFICIAAGLGYGANQTIPTVVSIIIILIILYFGIIPNILLFLFGIFLLTINLLWIGALLAILSARFRDMPQIIANLIQISFFLTPIIWQIDMAGRHFYLINFNPIYHFIEIVRSPLINAQINNLSFIFTSISAVIGTLITSYFFGKFYKRISFWV